MYVQEAFDMKEWLRQNGKIDIWKTEATRIRDILGNRKHRVQASILAGMLALALLGGSVPGSKPSRPRRPAEISDLRSMSRTGSLTVFGPGRTRYWKTVRCH